MKNERGIALIITLLVVSLLTITVVEFAYSVEIDQRMARNAINGLQATLLARSGINMGEAFLLHDDIKSPVDAFTEEWCPQAGPDAQSCLIDESNSQVVVPSNMRLRVQILDEGGKFNVNKTRPQTTPQWQQWHDKPENSPLIVFDRLCEQRGLDAHLSEALMDYWHTALATADQAVQQPAQGGKPLTPAQQQAAQQTRLQILAQFDFNTLDDLGMIAGITPTAINKLRPVMTAGTPTGVNINTAPRAVLEAIFSEHPEKVDEIISQRQSAPLMNAQQGAGSVVPLVITSQLFLIRASAIINPDPASGRGGIRRSASMLVVRAKATGGQNTGSSQSSAAGGLHWILRRMEWQKEGGAVLFDSRPDGEPGTDDMSPMGRDAQG